MKYIKLIDIVEKPQSGEWGSEDNSGDGSPVLRTTNFTNVGEVDYSDVVTRVIDSKKIEKKSLKKNDIIIEKSGGSDTKPVGRVVYFEGEDNKYLYNNFTAVLRIKNDSTLESKYLFYYLYHFYRMRGTVKFSNKTTGIHNLKLDDMLRNVNVPIVNKEEQIRTYSTLDKLRNSIKMREEQLKLLDHLIKSQFVEMFGTLDTNEKNFDYGSLKELCNKITDGKHGGCERVVGTGYYFVGAREIYDGLIHYDTAPEIASSDFEKDYKRCNVEKGDFLIVNTGATIGKSTIASDERTENTLLQKSVALIKTKKDKLLPVFLQYCYMVNPKMYLVESSSAQPNLLLSKIKETVIYIPPIDIQNQFATFVQQVDKLKFAIQKSLDETQTLFDALMQKYFGDKLQ